MNGEIQILAVELDGIDGLVVTFSDGTAGAYVVEELLELAPVRERLKTKKSSNVPESKVQPLGQLSVSGAKAGSSNVASLTPTIAASSSQIEPTGGGRNSAALQVRRVQSRR
jgi:hypothetical protein